MFEHGTPSIGTAPTDLAVLAGLSCLAFAYLRGVLRVTPLGHAWPRWRSTSFLIGLALIAAVTVGPGGAWAMSAFSGHMVQHLVLMMLAAPLLILGAPVLLVLLSTTREFRRRRVVPILRSRAFGVLTSPLLTWFAFATVLVGVHFTPFMSVTARMGALGALVEVALYLAVALAYYYPLLPGNPARNRPRPVMRIVSLLLMMVPETMTGFFIYTVSFPLTEAGHHSGLSPQQSLLDQRLGGALMWSASMIIDVAWMALAVSDWLATDARRTRRLDERLARET